VAAEAVIPAVVAARSKVRPSPVAVAEAVAVAAKAAVAAAVPTGPSRSCAV
jgi:hypothetical protein